MEVARQVHLAENSLPVCLVRDVRKYIDKFIPNGAACPESLSFLFSNRSFLRNGGW